MMEPKPGNSRRPLSCVCDGSTTKEHLHDGFGVYTIAAVSKRNRPIKIERACGTDHRGIIYIGRSSNLKSRLTTLCKMICTHSGKPWQGGHILGDTYKGSAALRRTYPPERLVFSSRRCSRNNDAKQLEANKLKQYLKRYGELPPGNAIMPKLLKHKLTRKA